MVKKYNNLDNIPENLQGTERYEKMEDCVSLLDDVISSIDDARNNKTYAHANTIMEKNEAEFLCTYMVYYYNFICKIDFKKIKI